MTTTSAHHVTCTVDDEGIARVWLDRPDKLNGLTLPMLRELAATGRRLAKDRSLRAVILTGAGESFSAGLDFASVLKDPRGIAAAFVPSLLRGTNTFQEAAWVWRPKREMSKPLDRVLGMPAVAIGAGATALGATTTGSISGIATASTGAGTSSSSCSRRRRRIA